MSSIICNYMGNAVLNQYFTSHGAYLSLHTADPGLNGDASTEVVGGDYARFLLNFSTPGNKTIANTTAAVFHNMPAVSVTWFALWTSATLGNILIRLQLGSLINVVVGSQLEIPPGDLAFTI